MDTRLRRAAASYVGDMRDRNLGPQYIRETRSRVSDFVTFCEGRGIKSVSAITADALREYLKRLDGLKGTTQKHIWGLMRTFLVFVGSPMAARFRYRATGRSRTVRWLDMAQKARLLSLSLSPRRRLMLVAGLYGGLRRIGVRRITREDAENALTTGVLMVVEKFSKERPISVHPMLRDALEEILRATDCGLSDNLIPIGNTQYTKEFVAISELAGFRVCSHDLRRTFAANLREMNADMETVSIALGHSALSTTQAYVQPMESRVRDAIQSLPIPVQIELEPAP